MNNHANIVKYVGLMSKRFVNETTENSQTALVLAAHRGHIEVVKQLLELKADFTISDDSDRTVLHYAIAYPEILKLLLKVSKSTVDIFQTRTEMIVLLYRLFKLSWGKQGTKSSLNVLITHF